MVKFIADVGSNFNESLEEALKYVRKCAEIGVDIVKFQCWRAEDLVSPEHPSYETLKAHTWGLPLEWHREVKEEADRCGIKFSTTPTQPYQIEKLEAIGVEIYKVASGDLTFHPLLKEINRTGKTVILSTGMAYLHEVEEAVNLLKDCEKIILLHCVSLYPPDYSEINLKAIATLKEYFPNCEVGLSDHTEDDVTAILSVALGATYIEKHITSSKDLPTPDAGFAMDFEGFRNMIERVRRAERSLGSGKKAPSPSERIERMWARRGAYAKRDLKKGEGIGPDDIVFLRPAKGIPPELEDRIVGKRLKKDVPKGRALFLDDLA